MAILKSCCCWGNVRSGTIACGVYTMIMSVIYSCIIVVVLSDYFNNDAAHVSVAKGWFLTTLVMCVFLFTTSPLLIIGVHKNNWYMLIPWVLVTLAMICVDTAALIYECIMIGWLYFNLIQMIMWLALTLLNLYCVLCVVSQIQELKAGRGTLEYLHVLTGRMIYHTGMQRGVQIHYGPLMMTCPRGTAVLTTYPPQLTDDVEPPPDYCAATTAADTTNGVASGFEQPLLLRDKKSFPPPPPPYCP